MSVATSIEAYMSGDPIRIGSFKDGHYRYTPMTKREMDLDENYQLALSDRFSISVMSDEQMCHIRRHMAELAEGYDDDASRSDDHLSVMMESGYDPWSDRVILATVLWSRRHIERFEMEIPSGRMFAIDCDCNVYPVASIDDYQHSMTCG